MKRIICFLISTFLVIGVVSNIPANKFEKLEKLNIAEKNKLKQVIKLSTSDNGYDLSSLANYITLGKVNIIREDINIYGNQAQMDEKDFRSIVSEGENKVYVHYRTDRTIDLAYDILLEVKTPEKIYSYEFIEKYSMNSNDILRGIREFIGFYIEEITAASDNNSSAFALRNVPTTFVSSVVDKQFVMRFLDMGYIIYHVGVSKYVATSSSIIYIVTVNNSFVPGIVAYNNGDKSYGKYKNDAGYAHTTVEQAYDASEEAYYGRRYGNIPYLKDYWPLNNPATVSIGSSITAGVNLGYSWTNGFSLDNINSSQSTSIGANVSYSYSKTITRSEPALTVQVASDKTSKAQWYYDYKDDASETYHQQTNYMFELENSRNALFIGDFRLRLDYKFVVDKGFFDAAQTLNGSADLMVRAGELKGIYNFNHGMI